MNVKLILAAIATCIMTAASAQTLFTYGSHAVDAKDFLKAYKKNNTAPVANKAKSISDYLQLYISSRLKVREAYDRRYDTLPRVTMEVNNLRTQIADNYMTDPGAMDRLSKEAFQRSLKDIHVAHIFISFKNAFGALDTITASQKKEMVIKQLTDGVDFLAVAQQYSDDPAAKTNKGDIGYVTVFTLPYEFENLIYTTAVGKHSGMYRSKAGYHFFKNLGERKAIGKIKVQQILLAIPPGTDEPGKKIIASLADSIYKRLLAKDDFGKLATQFSNDYISAATGGNIPDISVGQYEPAFENMLQSLPKDGAISKPFLTGHGWHIVKRISVKPPVTDPLNKANQNELAQKIRADKRWMSSANFMYDRITTAGLYKKKNYAEGALWAYADSTLAFMPMKEIGRAVNESTALFSIGDSTYTAGNWITYGRSHRFNDDGSGAKPHTQVLDEFVKASMKDYYRAHLEDFNIEFKDQMTEFEEGNLFFEVMQREVWDKAQTDSVALLNHYNKYKKNYTWNKSADAVVFFCSDQIVATTLYNQLKKTPADWRKITNVLIEKVAADSSKFTWDQLPNLGKTIPKAGLLTTPSVNSNDNTASFAYIVKVYTQPIQRTFTEARGLVVNDYQTILEKQWDESLKKKYPVVIDKKVLSEISK
jgi:peptidyl-prolyl cis-trans isomerase SurA